MIYRLALLAGRDTYIGIDNMPHHKFVARSQLKSRPLRRSTYDLTRPPIFPLLPRRTREVTTYQMRRFSLCSLRPNHYFSPNILLVNHQIRAEAVPIFYGENNFDISNHETVIPFLTDRTPLAIASICNVWLTVELYSTADELHIPDLGSSIEAIAQHLRLKSMGIMIMLDSRVSYHLAMLKNEYHLDANTRVWVDALAKIRGLDELVLYIRQLSIEKYSVPFQNSFDEMVKNLEISLRRSMMRKEKFQEWYDANYLDSPTDLSDNA